YPTTNDCCSLSLHDALPILVAVSDDPLLLNWEKVTGNAVIPIESNTGFPLPYRVFDPAIWKKDGIYYSLSAGRSATGPGGKEVRSEEHTSELQSRENLVCRL